MSAFGSSPSAAEPDAPAAPAPLPDTPQVSTYGSSLNDPASVCRERGWGPGTRLVGDEGYGRTVIEITAVGERQLLAKTISHDGKPVNRPEGEWVLALRDWRPIGDAGAHDVRGDESGPNPAPGGH